MLSIFSLMGKLHRIHELQHEIESGGQKVIPGFIENCTRPKKKNNNTICSLQKNLIFRPLAMENNGKIIHDSIHYRFCVESIGVENVIMTTVSHLLFSIVFIGMKYVKNYLHAFSLSKFRRVVRNQYIYGSYFFLNIGAMPGTHFIYFVIFLTIQYIHTGALFFRGMFYGWVFFLPASGQIIFFLLDRGRGCRAKFDPGLTTYLRRTLLTYVAH